MNQDPTAVQFVLIVIGIPIAIIAVIALIVLAPGWTRAGRYRPGDAWDHEPVVIGANGSKSAAAIESVQPAQLTGAAADAAVAAPTSTTGGISVRW